MLLLISCVWIIMCVHSPILFLVLSHHVSRTAASWLFLCYFWRMGSHICSVTSMMAWVWNLNVITVMTLMLLECLRMGALSKSIILRAVIHDHFWLKRLIYDMWIVSLARHTTSTHIALEWLMHELLWAKIWSGWHLFLAVDFARRWGNWSTTTHAAGIVH